MFFAAFVLMFLFAVTCWLICLATLPRFKRTYPDQYVAAGSPSPWTWSLASINFLTYLIRGEFRALPDSNLVLRLQAIKLFW